MKLTEESHRSILIQTWGLIIIAITLILSSELWELVMWTLLGIGFAIFICGLDILEYEDDDFP